MTKPTDRQREMLVLLSNGYSLVLVPRVGQCAIIGPHKPIFVRLSTIRACFTRGWIDPVETFIRRTGLGLIQVYHLSPAGKRALNGDQETKMLMSFVGGKDE